MRKLSEKTGLPPEEIRARIREEVEKFKGLITEETAAYIIAQSLGVSLLPEPEAQPSRLTVDRLMPGMRRVRLRGRVVKMYGVLEYTRRDGSTGLRGEFRLADETGEILVVVWDSSLIEEIESGGLAEGDVVEIVNGRVSRRPSGELVIHLGSGSSVERLEGEFPEYPEPVRLVLSVEEVTEDVVGEEIDVEGTLVSVSDVRRFQRRDGSEGYMRSLLLSGGEEEIRVVLWGPQTGLVEGVPLGSELLVKNLRVNLRNGEVELHSTSRTKVEVVRAGAGATEALLEGRVLYRFGVEEPPGGRRFLDLLVETDGGLILMRAWDPWVDLLSSLEIPALIRAENIFWTRRRGVRMANLGPEGSLEVVEEGMGKPPAGVRESALSLKYPRTWLDLSGGEGSREIRGTVVDSCDTIRVRWRCRLCGARVETEYGRFICPSCGEVEDPVPRLSMWIRVDDGFGVATVVLSGRAAEDFAGVKAEELIDIMEQEGFEGGVPLERIGLSVVGREVVVRGRVSYSEETMSIRVIADEVSPADTEREIARLLREIRELLEGRGASGEEGSG